MNSGGTDDEFGLSVPARLRPGRQGGDCPLAEGGRLTVPPGAIRQQGGPRRRRRTRRAGGKGGGGGALVTAWAVDGAGLADCVPVLAPLEVLASPVYRLRLTGCRDVAADAADDEATVPAPLLKLPLVLPTRPDPAWPTGLRLLHRPEPAMPLKPQPTADAAVLAEPATPRMTRLQWRELTRAAEDARSVTCRAGSSGVYLVTQRPLEETFQVTPRGGFHRIRMCPRASVRLPRGACAGVAECRLTIQPFPVDDAGWAKAAATAASTSDLLALSPVYDFRLSAPLELRRSRPATLRLPLPRSWPEAAGATAAVLCQAEDSVWRALEAPSPTPGEADAAGIVAFDTVRLGAAFCLALLRPGTAGGPQRVAASALPLLRGLAEAPPGRLLAFADLRPRPGGWRLCLRWQLAAAAVAAETPPMPPGEWQQVGAVGPVLRLREGATFEPRLAGDLRLAGGSGVRAQFRRAFPALLAVFPLLPSDRCEAAAAARFQRLAELPMPTDESPEFRAQLSIIDEEGEIILADELTVDFACVRDFLCLQQLAPAESPPPPPPPPTLTTPQKLTPRSPAKAPGGIVRGDSERRARTEGLQRLMARQRNHQDVPTRDRESKVLSGRSLLALSERVQHLQLGLSLARHLRLPEAAVAGLEFDAAPQHAAGAPSSGSLAYKALLLWKRSVAAVATPQPAEALAQALAAAGQPGLADAVRRCHAENRELTPADAVTASLESGKLGNGSW